MPTLSLKTSFLTLLLGSEGKSQGASEWTGSDPVPLHAVARHGSSRVCPPGPDLREEVLSSPDSRNGPCVGALQVRPTASPFFCLGFSIWIGQSSGCGLCELGPLWPCCCFVWFRNGVLRWKLGPMRPVRVMESHCSPLTLRNHLLRLRLKQNLLLEDESPVFITPYYW